MGSPQLMTAMMRSCVLLVRSTVVDTILCHARESYPNEVAGVVGADSTETIVAALELCRGTRTHVRVPAAMAAQARASITSLGLTPVGSYHSHPRTPAYPTRADRMIMRAAEVMLIVSVRFDHLKGFCLAPDGMSVAELRIVCGDDR